MKIIHSYSGNVSASFAVYFVVRILTSGWRYGRLVTAGIVLLVVELFEVTNGFGVMTNVYDSVDFVDNAVGVVLALSLGSFQFNPEYVEALAHQGLQADRSLLIDTAVIKVAKG